MAGLTYQAKMYFMHEVNNEMVPRYISDLFLPLISESSGYPLDIIITFLHHSLEQMFHQKHVYHQPSECGTISMKLSKTNHQHHPSSITYTLL